MDILNFDTLANISKNPLFFTNVKDEECMNPNSAHGYGQKSFISLTNAHNIVKNLFDQYTTLEFVPGGGSLANERAFFGPKIVKNYARPTINDVIVVSSIEHSSISKHILQILNEKGYTIIIIPVTNSGIIDLKEFTTIIEKYADRIILVSCMMTNNEIGVRQPIEEMIKITKSIKLSVIFHSDCGLDFEKVNNFEYKPDIITFSCYKIRGPHYGIVLALPHVEFRNHNYGTPDVYNIMASAVSTKYYFDNFQKTKKQQKDFKNILISTLDNEFSKHNIAIYKLVDDSMCIENIYSFIIPCLKASYIQQKLSEKNIYIGSGSACTTNTGSHTLKSMGFDSDMSQKLIRLSFDIFPDKDSQDIVNILAKEMCEIIKSSNRKTNKEIKLYNNNFRVIMPSGRKTPDIVTENNISDISKDNAINIVTDTIKLTYAELSLKGGNKKSFIDRLDSDIKNRLKRFNIKFTRDRSYHLINIQSPTKQIIEDIIIILKNIPGIATITPICYLPYDINNFEKQLCLYAECMYKMEKKTEEKTTYVVRAKIKNVNKNVNKNSKDIEYLVGKYLGDKFSDSVDLKNPEIFIGICIENMKIGLYSKKYEGICGLPMGSEGKIIYLVFDFNIENTIKSIIEMGNRGILPVILADANINIEKYNFLIERSIEICGRVSHCICDISMLSEIEIKKDIKHMIIEPCNIFSTEDMIKWMTFLKCIGNKIDMHVWNNCHKNENENEKKDLNSCIEKVKLIFNIDIISNQLSQKGLLLISGGIDSPVVSHMLIKQEIQHDYIHFIGNINDEISKQKIVNICKQVGNKCKIYFVHFGDLQEKIADMCDEDYRVMLYKIMMVKIACSYKEYGFIAMGNSWGQVASQTNQNIYATDYFSELPIYSPLLGWNKLDIIKYATNAGTYKHSICNSNDCCVMFLPKNPVLAASTKVIKSQLDKIKNFEQYIKIEIVET